VASLTYGAAGVAYALYRIAVSRGDGRVIALADQWSQRAYALADDPDAFYDSELGVSREMVGDVSLFHSAAGLHFVRALVSASVGDLDTSHRASVAFVEHSRRRCQNPDLTLGKASILLALSEILENLPGSAEQVSIELSRHRGDELAEDLHHVLSDESMATSTLLPALGIAHGWAGLLYALLRWSIMTGVPPNTLVRERLDELLGWAEPHAGGVRWPVHNSSFPPDYVDGWCNGTAGHSLLFALAYDVLGRDEYAQAAVEAAESAHTTETGLGTLCCGLGGVAYALLCAHRITGDEKWRVRAEQAARSAAGCRLQSFYPDSLYKGAVGIAVLAQDLRDPANAAMPVFEPMA
jgi:serine/threonine-protein kinase